MKAEEFVAGQTGGIITIGLLAMQNTEPLLYLGIVVMIATAIAVLVPYLRGRSDVFTSWNILLLGGAMFIGGGSIAVTQGPFHWTELQWFQPTKSDVQKYIVGVIVFYTALFFSYFVLKWPKRIASRAFNNWPPMTLPFLLISLAFFGTVALVASFTPSVFFIGPLLTNVSHKAIIFAVVFSFCYWYEHKWQLVFFALFVGVFVFAAIDAMVLFRGRRLLLSVAVAPLISLYWLRWRYLPPAKNLLRIAVATFLILSVAAVYNTFRHFSGRQGGPAERTFATTIEAMKSSSAESAFKSIVADPLYFFSQYCGHYSLLTIHLIDAGQIEIEPLNTLAFLATYPVPRAIFPAKPQSLGIRIVREVLRLPYATNWGLGIVANGYHEGGLPVIILYALLMVIIVRTLDEALVRQPRNPFLLAVLSTTSPHFAALIRGDPTNMSAEIIEAFVFAWAFGLVARFFIGTASPSEYAAATPTAPVAYRSQYPHTEGESSG